MQAGKKYKGDTSRQTAWGTDDTPGLENSPRSGPTTRALLPAPHRILTGHPTPRPRNAVSQTQSPAASPEAALCAPPGPVPPRPVTQDGEPWRHADSPMFEYFAKSYQFYLV